MEIQIGAVLDGRWRTVRRIGQGGMATVYLAEQVSLGRMVAVKVLNAGHVMADELRNRFEREIRAMTTVSHAHVVPLHEVGQTGGVPYLVLGYMEGGSLRLWLTESGGRLPCQRVQRWLLHVSEALDFFHSRGLIHRDVKPDNILFDAAGDAFLSDFGIVRGLGPETQALTRVGQLVGTLPYLSPEALDDQPPAPARDQYALGVTVYEALAGRLPFVATSYSSLVTQILTDAPPSLQKLAPDVPSPCVDAVMRALAREPSQRHSNCVAFATAFSEGLSKAELKDDRRRARSFSYDPAAVAALSNFLRDGKEGFGRNFCRNGQGMLTVTHGRTGLQFVLIPGGEFLMGARPGEEGHEQDELPAHRVRVRPFLLSATLCTQQAWTKGDGRGRGGNPDLCLPIRGVQWSQARAWCRQIGLRLPSEAEWEYACRAGATTRFSCGEMDRELSDRAWYIENSDNRIHPVGELRPNAWGLFDMNGDVWEWCEDSYHPSYEGAPGEGPPWCDRDSPLRIVRGGAWSSPAKDCRSATRNRWPPEIPSEAVGFRPAASLPDPG